MRRVERHYNNLSPTLYMNSLFLTNRAMNDWGLGFAYTEQKNSIYTVGERAVENISWS